MSDRTVSSLTPPTLRYRWPCLLAVLCLAMPVLARGQDEAPAAADSAALGTAFSSEHAHFQPVPFEQIPGWRTDSLLASIRGLRQSCAALAQRAEWSGLCAEIAQLGADTEVIRQFFQRHFLAYRVSSASRTDGRISGYFEPVLEGSRQRVDDFQIPVYGQPRDLLLLDAGSLTGAARQAFVLADGILRPAAAGDAAARDYAVELASVRPDGSDGRYRVRVEADRILPYYSRAEIAQRALDAPVLAWVNDPLALHLAQIQGVGQIRMREGDVLRLVVAGQNGRPLRARNRANELSVAGGFLTTRGQRAAGARPGTAMSDEDLLKLIASLDSEPETTAPKSASNTAKAGSRPAQTPALASNDNRRQAAGKPAATATPRSPGRIAPTEKSSATAPAADREQEVAAMVAALSRPAPAAPSKPALVASTEVASNPAPTPAVTIQPQAETPASARLEPGSNDFLDPGYAFFRASTEAATGPVGALGVPLTAGRSLAVDPRTAPLGSPVFISTSAPGSEVPLRRLMFAQDTSIAALGQIGGELFWGTGDTARRLSEATLGSVQMWLLLPRGLAMAPGAGQ